MKINLACPHKQYILDLITFLRITALVRMTTPSSALNSNQTTSTKILAIETCELNHFTIWFCKDTICLLVFLLILLLHLCECKSSEAIAASVPAVLLRYGHFSFFFCNCCGCKHHNYVENLLQEGGKTEFYSWTQERMERRKKEAPANMNPWVHQA